jgi:hypothetical protein
VSRDDAVPRHDLLFHAEVAAPVRHELVDFLEGAGVEQQVDALSRGQLARGVLAIEPVAAAAELGSFFKICENVVRICHGQGLMANRAERRRSEIAREPSAITLRL